MLFLIQYDRRKGTLVEFRKFEEWERQRAQDTRLELELALNERGVEDEVVILDAPSEEALRRTHGRYFNNLAELVEEITAKP
jgi:hypothetical protein